MKIEAHRESCRWLYGLGCYCEGRMEHEHSCDCNGPRDFNDLIEAARHEVKEGTASGALRMVLKRFDEADD